MNVAFELTIFNAFLGAITEGVRAIAYDFHSGKITIYVYLDRDTNEDDYEIIDIALTEIIASCPEILSQDIHFVNSNEVIGKLPSYKEWVFIRHE